jgi:hypothetical protein
MIITMRHRSLLLTCLTIFVVTGRPAGAAIEAITNGGFETGDLSGWVLVDAGSGSIAVQSGIFPPNGVFSTVGPSSGDFYAVSYQDGPGTHAILQSFTIAPGSTATLSFDLFVQTAALEAINPAGLDHNAFPNQHARVDILSSGASPFDTGAGVLGNFYLGIDGVATQPYTSYSFDISSLVGAGGTFQLRFAQSDNQGNFNMGVDNASIMADSSVVPEPATLFVWSGLGLAAAYSYYAKKKRAHGQL